MDWVSLMGPSGASISSTGTCRIGLRRAKASLDCWSLPGRRSTATDSYARPLSPSAIRTR